MKRFTLLLFSITILFTLLVSLSNCGKEKTDPLPTTTPTVVTGDVSSVTTTTATGSGQIVSDGNVTVTERGVVIGKTADPTINDTKVLSGKGAGTFSVEVTGLTANTTYHLRAFGTNAKGTSYGLDKLFTTLPTVTTSSVSAITLSAASSGGTITSDGGAAITARGICWSASPNPTISNSKTTDGSGEGTFTSNLISLNSGTKYYVRAYATNSVGTAYGNEVSFTTLLSPVPTNGLVAWYPFNGNANDESGNGNHGANNGAILTTDRKGNSSNAYYFSGSACATRIDASINTASIQTGLTISIWVSKTGEGCISPRIFEFRGAGDGPGQAQGSWPSPNPLSKIYLGSVTTTGFYCGYEIPIVANNVWTHITYTNDGISGKFYQDGSLIGTVQSTGNPILSGNAAFGRMNHSAWDAFNGKLDDIGIWNRALSADEVLKIYNGTGF